jgi:4-aminobutyrate aminotransferase-like enzyme
VRGEGVWLYDKKGRRYLDGYNNVPSVGHCHPDVVAAVSRQAATLNTHTRYLFEQVVAYAERLLKTVPPELENVMFTCSGSESIDLALRIARFVGRGEGIIATRDAYHGTTAAASEISPSRGTTSPNVRTVPAPDAYRKPKEQVGKIFADDVAAAIADLKQAGIKFAGLVVDTVFSSDGLHLNPPGFLKSAVDVVRREGGVMIADEVQAGFARTGKMWGFQRHGIVPDIVVLGKPMGNGMPIGGVVVRADLLTQFGAKQRYFNTFGGNPVCCAAGLAVLDVIEREKLTENAGLVGSYLLAGLSKLKDKYSSIGDVRGAGLSVGVEFVTSRQTKEPDSVTSLRLVNDLREEGILINALGPYRHVLKIRPPLPFSKANADQVVSTIDALLSRY